MSDNITSSEPNFHRTVPDGDEFERLVCKRCDFIHYENPKIIAGAVIEHQGQLLLCRRAIEPRAGYWTVPAGFMELGETPNEGAARESFEEARATIEVGSLLGVYTVKRISQVHMMYRAKMTDPHFEPGPESREVALFKWEDIPWPELAFPSVTWALRDYHKVRGVDDFAPFSNPEGYQDV